MGNEAADHADRKAHKGAQHLAVLFVAADSNRFVRVIGKLSALALWLLPAYHQLRLHELDPQLTYRPPPNLPGAWRTVLHHLCLSVSFTGYNLFKIKHFPSPDCPACGIVKAATHLIIDCALYICIRAVLKKRST